MKLKICGMKFTNNIGAVAKLLPDFMGFIFYPKSKRFVGNELRVEQLKSLNPKIQKVGVFVNATLKEIFERAEKYNLQFVQLHGKESPKFCEQIKKGVELKIIKVFRIGKKFDFKQTESYQSYCDYFLFDTASKEYGGSGKTFDWKILNSYNHSLPFFLSGGIDLENIEQIKKLNGVKPFALDINSKFEIQAGVKDTGKIKQFRKMISNF